MDFTRRSFLQTMRMGSVGAATLGSTTWARISIATMDKMQWAVGGLRGVHGARVTSQTRAASQARASSHN